MEFLFSPCWDASPCQYYPSLNIEFACSSLFTCMEWGTLRVKCLTQEHNTITRLAGWENDISWCYLWFPLELMYEKCRNSKLMLCHDPDLDTCACDCYFASWHDQLSQTIRCSAQIGASWVWNVCVHSSDIISRGSQRLHWDMLAVLWLWQGWKPGFFIFRL